MKRFFEKLVRNIQIFMYGRHGQDTLSHHLICVGFAVWAVSLFIWRFPLAVVYTLLCAYSIFRTMSRNHAKREKELRTYMKLIKKLRDFFKLQKNRYRDRKTHRYFKCRCGAILRVPKGKGEIIIHCPKCKNSFEKKT